MWRSVARRRASCSLSLAGRPKSRPSIQNLLPLSAPQVLPQTFPRQFPSHFSTLLFSPNPKFSPHKNPRFFSVDASNPIVIGSNTTTDEAESIGTESLSIENAIFADTADGTADGIFDENPKDAVFGENPSEDLLTMDGFAEVEEESVVVENETLEVDLEQLESVLSLLQSSGSSAVDGSLGSGLDDMGLTTLSEDFVVRVVETPLVPAEMLIGFFKWASKKVEFPVTARALDALVSAVCSGEVMKWDAYALWDLVKGIGEAENGGVLTTKALNEVISLFSRLRKGKAAFEVFNKIEEFGCVADSDSYFYTVEALCRRKTFDWAGLVCEKMLDVGKLPDVEKIGKIISYMCRGRKAKDAYFVYLMAKENDKCLPRSSLDILIGSLSQEDETVPLALEMLEDYSVEERKNATKPFTSVVWALCRNKDVDGAKGLLSKMIDAGPPPGFAVFNLIINRLSKSGDMEEALKIMKLMESRGLKPDVYTYTVIMSGYAKGGEMEEACKVFAEAKKKHSKLSPATYHTLIRGYCKLEEFDKALKLLSEMKEFGVQPNVDEYSKLIQSLCLRAVDWETAEKLLEEMKKSGLHLNGITKALIRATKELDGGGVETETVSVEA